MVPILDAASLPAAGMCACGRPLHYSSPRTRAAVDRLIALAGDGCLTIRTPDGAYRVQRHYLALHGIRASELPSLGFERVAS